MIYHIPVLLREVIEQIAPKKNGVYVDCTFGGGGHTTAILQADPTCKVIAFDWDREVIDLHKEKFEELFPGRIEFVWANFAQISLKLKKIGVKQVDGILADFGTSQHQIANKSGLSFSRDTPLDMRMSAGHHFSTAETIVNHASERELAQIFWDYGQERYGRQIAEAIVAARKKKRLLTTGELADLIMGIVPRRPGIHPATKVFQALRIVVNKELENIQAFLSQAGSVLKPGGRLVCISFHSLEDRLVKQFLREQHATFKLLTSRVVVAAEDELATNPSARSAKLRAAIKI